MTSDYLYSSNTSSVFPDIGRPIRYQPGVIYKPLNGLSVASEKFYSTTVLEIDPDVTPLPTHLLISIEELQDSFMEIQLGHRTHTFIEIRYGTEASTFHPPDQTIPLTTGNFTGSYLIAMKYTRRFICGRSLPAAAAELRRPFSVSVSMRVLGKMSEKLAGSELARGKLGVASFGAEEVRRRVKIVQYPLTAALSVRTFSAHDWDERKFMAGVCGEVDEWLSETSFGGLRTVSEELGVAKSVMVGASVFDNRRNPMGAIDAETRQLMEDWRLTPFAIEPLIAQVAQGSSGAALSSCMTIGEVESFGAVGVVSLLSSLPRSEALKVCLVSRSASARPKTFDAFLPVNVDLAYAKKVLTAAPSVPVAPEESLFTQHPWLNSRNLHCPTRSTPDQSARTSDIMCTDVLRRPPPKARSSKTGSKETGSSKTVVGWPLLWSTNDGVYEVQQLLVNASTGRQLSAPDHATQAFLVAPVQGCFRNCNGRGYCRSELLPGAFIRHSCRCLPGYTGPTCELQAHGASQTLQTSALILTNLFILLPAWLCLHFLRNKSHLYKLSPPPPALVISSQLDSNQGLDFVVSTQPPASTIAATVSTDDDGLDNPSFPPWVASSQLNRPFSQRPYYTRPPFVVVPQAPITLPRPPSRQTSPTSAADKNRLNHNDAQKGFSYDDLVDRTESQACDGDGDDRSQKDDRSSQAAADLALVDRGESLCVSLVAEDYRRKSSKKVESETVEIDEQDLQDLRAGDGGEDCCYGRSKLGCGRLLRCPLYGHRDHGWILCPLFGQQVHLVLLLLVLLNVGFWSSAYHACETGGRCFVPSSLRVHSVGSGLPAEPSSLMYLFSGSDRHQPAELSAVTGSLFEQVGDLLNPNCPEKRLSPCTESSALQERQRDRHAQVYHLDSYKSKQAAPMQPYQQTNYLQFKVKWSHLHDIDKFFAYWAFYLTTIPLGRFNLLINSLFSVLSGLAVGYRVIHHSGFLEPRMIRWTGSELAVLVLICAGSAWWSGRRLPPREVWEKKSGRRAFIGLLTMGLIFCCLGALGWQMSRSIYFPYWLSHSFWHISILSSPTFFIYAFNLLDIS